MTDFTFSKATKRRAKLRLALIGPSGSGKTYTALTIAPTLGDKIAVIDTEHGSASKYADLFNFDVLELDTFSPLTYADAIHSAEKAGYDVIIIDSLSHAWAGKEGALEQVDKATARSASKNSYTAWRDVTPMHNSLIDAMIQSSAHIIATMRTKTDYVMEKDERTGKMAPHKVGLAPVQRDGVEYEFDVIADMDLDNTLIVSKTRCPTVNGLVLKRPTVDFGKTLASWLGSGEAPLPPRTQTTTLTLDQARNMYTEKGTQLGMLNYDQLKLVSEKSKRPELVAAAQLIMTEWDKTINATPAEGETAE